MPAITNLAGLDQTPHAELFDSSGPRTVRLQLDAGEHIPEHQHPETILVFHLLRGELELEIDGETITLGTDDVARFKGDQDISPHAVTDCEALIVFAPAA